MSSSFLPQGRSSICPAFSHRFAFYPPVSESQRIGRPYPPAKTYGMGGAGAAAKALAENSVGAWNCCCEPALTMESGESGGTRTRNHRLKRAMLYQLSYRPRTSVSLTCRLGND